jgi:predicted nucleic acid-binding protein
MFDLLDTNFLSELRKPKPNQLVMAYSLSRPPEELFISTVTLAEVRFGIVSQQDRAKREALQDWLEQEIRPMFADRVVPISEAVILRWRVLLEQGRKSGRVFSQPDLIIAATAIEHNLTFVTRNTKDFTGLPDLKLLNPWEPRT